MPWFPAVLLVLVLILLVVYLQFRWRYRHILATASQLPCPPTLPLLGNIPLLLSSGDRFNITIISKQESLIFKPLVLHDSYTSRYHAVRPIRTSPTTPQELQVQVQMVLTEDHGAVEEYLGSKYSTVILRTIYKGGSSKNIFRSVEKFKGLFCIWVGPFPLFVVKDPANAQIILNSSGTIERDDMYSLFRTFLGNGLLSAPAHIWKKYRKLINPVMHASNVENFLPVFNDVGRKLTERFAASTAPSDHSDDIFDLALDATTRTVISKSRYTDETKKEVKYLIPRVGGMFILRLFKVWLHVDWLFRLLYRKELKEIFKKYDYLMDIINKGWKEEDNIRRGIASPDQSIEREL
ncbi:hypothetical protein J6590_076167 [Homalodisca vitripennis]|nr:hypothetical protein J6590_076167 [Homalodisca vitripennis]